MAHASTHTYIHFVPQMSLKTTSLYYMQLSTVGTYMYVVYIKIYKLSQKSGTLFNQGRLTQQRIVCSTAVPGTARL